MYRESHHSKEDLFTQLDKFFNPNSVAVIGASSKPGKIGYEILRSLAQYGYSGKVYPITLRSQEILGIKCYRSILEIPDSVDLAVLAIPSQFTPEVFEECGQKGVKNVVIVSGGFKEVGDESKDLEGRVVSIAKKYGIRIIGPNCIGVFNGKNRLDTFFQAIERMARPEDGPIAFITQSGTFGVAFLEWAAESGIGVSKMVSYGNRSDVDEADLLRYLGSDPDTRVIGMYVEAVGDGRRLVEAAEEVVRSKPIVILKSGRTDVGVKAALSHTGWLAGSYPVSISAFRQAGMIVVKDFEELFDVCKAFALLPLPKGNRVGMITNGAGPSVMAVDVCSELGIEVGRYSEKTIESLKKKLPSYALPRMVIDLTGSANSMDYRIGCEALLEDQNVDLLIPFFVFQDTPLDEGIVDVMADMVRYGKPIIACAAGGSYSMKQSRALEVKGIPVYPTAERAVAAAYALITYSEIRGKVRAPAIKEIELKKLEDAVKLLKGVRAGGRGILYEYEAKELLKLYGINTTENRVAASAEEAVKFAEELGLPVVLKILSPDVAHKTDVGGVKLDLKTVEEVYRAFEEIESSLKKSMPEASFQGVLVQNMVRDGVEVIVGGLRDAEFGPLVMFGLGGIFVEVLKDTSFRLVPLSKEDALSMIKEIKGYPILTGVRGRAPADIESLTDLLLRVSRLMTDLTDISELDLNPISVDHERAVVLDARVVLK